MTYPYGTKGAPAVGGGLPGLPRRAYGSKPQMLTSVLINTSTGGQFVKMPKPDGAKYMRLAIIGAGAGSSGGSAGSSRFVPLAGGGGGCAATDIILANEFFYLIGKGGVGSVGTADTSGEASVVELTGRVLIGHPGTGGMLGSDFVEYGRGGAAEGGDFNYQGGDAGEMPPDGYEKICGGGGSAAPGGRGGKGGGCYAHVNGNQPGEPGENDNNGWLYPGRDGGRAYRRVESTGGAIFVSAGGSVTDLPQPLVHLTILGSNIIVPSSPGGGGAGAIMRGYQTSRRIVGDGGDGALIVEYFS